MLEELPAQFDNRVGMAEFGKAFEAVFEPAIVGCVAVVLPMVLPANLGRD
jgi:hypothetical protein